MRDITLEETFRFPFTTRAFATGTPTILAGTPVLSVLEENNATPITVGVSISVDRASVGGLNEGTIIATAANGYEAGKSYGVYISTGTVSGVSVIGEVVYEFTIELSSAFTRLGAPAGASVSADIAAIPTTAMRGTDSAALASVATEARLSELDEATGGKMANQVDIIQIDTTTDLPAQITALNNVSIADILASQLTESYAADGVAPTLSQAIFLIQQILGDFAIAGTTLTVRKIDGSSTAATFTLDDATNPTALTRAT